MDERYEQHKKIEEDAEKVGMGKEFVKRELNVGFSGGEKKRMEMMQMMVLQPKAVVLDEIDSGLDIDGLKRISESINSMKNEKRCFLIITHYPRILHYLNPDRVHVLVKGKIAESGDMKLAERLEKEGYGDYGN